MRDVAIIGAGEIGGALAHVLARRSTVRSVRLIDEAGRVAAGKALDIEQAAPIDGSAVPVAGSSELFDAAAAQIVVLADRFKGGELNADEAVGLLRQVAAFSNRPLIVCAGAHGREAVERGVREIGVGRSRLFGTAPEALSSAVRALVALEINGSASEVALTVTGVPPTRVVIPWSDATVAGMAAARALNDVARQGISARVAALWPPGPYALANAAAHAIDAVLGRNRRISCAFVAPDDSSGRKERAVALPVRLGLRGIEAVIAPALTAHDRITLENAMML